VDGAAANAGEVGGGGGDLVAGRGELGQEVVAGEDGWVAGRVVVRAAGGEHLDEGVVVAVVEEGGGAAQRGVHVADGRRGDPVQRRSPAVVGPLGEQVPEVHQEGPVDGDDTVPVPVGADDLQTGHGIGVEHRHDPVVGVGAHPHLAGQRIGAAGRPLVADDPQRVGGVVGLV